MPLKGGQAIKLFPATESELLPLCVNGAPQSYLSKSWLLRLFKMPKMDATDAMAGLRLFESCQGLGRPAD